MGANGVGGSDRASDRRHGVTALLLTGAVIVGLTAMGGAFAADDPSDEILVDHQCEDDVNYLLFENPTDEPVELEVSWEPETAVISVESDGPLPTAIQTTTENGETTQRLGTAVPADETVVLAGLSDGSYGLSTADDEPAANLADDEVTLDCGAATANGEDVTLTTLERAEIDLEEPSVDE